VTPTTFDGDRFAAVLFDMDGVLTSTTALHARCWKEVLDDVLVEWSRRTQQTLPEFDLERDYVPLLDGRTRADGVRDFLEARGIKAPEGAPQSPGSDWSVNGIANRKQSLVEQALRIDRVAAFPGSIRWVTKLRSSGKRTAVVSSSADSAAVLDAAGISQLFDTRVDGHDVARLRLRGKPAPDSYLEAASRLTVHPMRAVVVEDALAGVAAGRAGGFGLVIGVARNAGRGELSAAGAHLVVDDLAELV
jgi:alpha,alpha-trehalose phosphorylase